MGTVEKFPGRKGKTEEREVAPTPEERFVQEFLIDRDPIAAALRTGVAAVAVKRKAQQWMSSPDIQKRIQEATDNQDPETMVSAQRIIAGFLDVAFDRSAPSASRNTALRELAAMKGLYPKEDKDQSKKYAKSVMLVPADVPLSDWSRQALEQQKKLKDDVRK